MAPLLPWKKHQHIRDALDKKWEELRQKYKEKVHFIPKLSKLAFGVGNDDVHLVDKSRERFFNHVIESSLAAFVCERQDKHSTADEDDSIDMDTQDQTIVQGRIQSTSTPNTFRQTKRRRRDEPENIISKRARNYHPDSDNLESLKRKVENRWKSDALVIAKHDEQLDRIHNEKTLDRIVMTGVVIENLAGTLEERKPIMFEAITKILQSFMEEPPAPTYANHLNAQFRTPRRVLEVRFGNTERALQVRKAYSAKIKECRVSKVFPNELNGVNIGLTLTKATRIRIAILKGLAKIVNDNTENEVNAYCLEFQPQPMLKIVINVDTNKQTSRTYGFTEAIDHVAEHFYINDHDLTEAYTLAGNMKHLEQRFVVLKNR